MQSINRTTEVAGKRNEQVVYNTATVAIDRSKAKIEYMFNVDPRWPRGLPGDGRIEDILRNTSDDDPEFQSIDLDPAAPGIQDPYTFPDEERLDLDGDGRFDNAWVFTVDTDEGTATVAYMLLHRVQSENINLGLGVSDIQAPDYNKASNLLVRNGPINMTQVSQVTCINPINNQDGWEVITGATVRRAFQTYVVVVEDRGTQRSVSTLEMQQDRQADKGNKWGAWFRNDLEIFPGPGFRWNGAIHTEGNLIIGDSNNFEAYLISAPNSCLYARPNSEITVGGNLDEITPPFLGQIIRGSLKFNSYTGSFRADIHGANGPEVTVTVNDSTGGNNHIDSVRSSPPPPIDISLDPVVLFTTNDNVARGNDETNGGNRDPNWKNSRLVRDGRIFNRSAQPPYVDDTYRSDDRYGPKPRYSQLIGLNAPIGTPINPSDTNANLLTEINTLDPESNGLDGYWEKRSRGEGLTVIVGQRLELGNANGWDGNQDPLYPPQGGYCPDTGTRCHEQKQWKTLRDNLAAVQATVVYHNDRQTNQQLSPIAANFPLACLATTAHPGTRTGYNNTLGLETGGTIGNSYTFGRVAHNNNVDTNFLEGVGTSGWEFNTPGNQTTNANFRTAIANGTPLRNALRNLGNFSGDPFGAFPPVQDSDDSNNTNDAVSIGPVVHPYPTLTMWGDFSNLRRVMAQLDGGTDYNSLSIADQTTLQTAACTLGMLAYNLDNILSYDYTNANNADRIQQVIRSLNHSSITDYINDNLPGDTLPEKQANATPEDYIAAFQASTVTVSGNTLNNRNLVPTVRAIYLKEQVTRDRRFGFRPYVSGIQTAGNDIINWSSNTSPTRWVTFNPADNGYFGLDPSSTWTERNQVRTLARALSPRRIITLPNRIIAPPETNRTAMDTDRTRALVNGENLISTVPETGQQIISTPGIKYPALYYLFPTATHNHDGGGLQPNTEEYIGDAYILEVNKLINYQAVNPGDLVLTPRNRTDWVVPNTTTTTDRVNFINDDGTNVAIAFQDKGMFNGREMMSVRSLDIDLDLLRRNTLFNGRENWLPFSGIVYGFREDAVREDAIARPTRGGVNFNNCDRASEITSTSCRMDAVTDNPHDPPVNDTNGISPKPVDFHADPDRRAHGFRLRTGGSLVRVPEPPGRFQFKGLSFISDNPVYISADNNVFNDHRNTAGQEIQEFTQLLNNDWTNFYSRTTLNDQFARAGDTWRPAEIISDGITILSNNFINGSIAEGIDRNNVSNRSSYRTLNAPNDPGDRRWVREDGSVSDAQNNAIPIKISRNGYPLYCVDPANVTNNRFDDVTTNNTQFQYCRRHNFQEQQYGRERDRRPLGFSELTGNLLASNINRTYQAFTNGKDRIDAANNNRVNVTVVSGLIPSRAQQSYGGLHNFPRFIENWNGRNLFISGALIQLNFSTYATGPFDQDSWEPGQGAQSAEPINYYGAPTRRWGYDVGLQYSPAGPVASRFISPSSTRSEFYREPPVDDPYICLLRKASLPDGASANIDPDTTNCRDFPWE
ncbi:MAG: hypothetical protein EA365_09695 [Gloeocapsa sp. DLM2.Bin57]|nr:MAG: hypothetical protein EA365_09695 [Gloeocapsa sp. DLM2.Bin57]